MQLLHKTIIVFLTGVLCFVLGTFVGKYYSSVKKVLNSVEYRWNREKPANWSKQFSATEIPSRNDGHKQLAMYLSAKPYSRMPLIVSLHTWSGDYRQADPLAQKAKEHGWNYIHPNFRGPNNTIDACLSDKAVSDIDDAIQYAVDQGYVDVNNIFVVGVSGGGYATLGSYLKTRHAIKAFLAWAPISDLSAWYWQSKHRSNLFSKDIEKCVSEDGIFEKTKALSRSPLFWPFPSTVRGRIEIYAGINDGYTGSVPITHSIHFYNKIVAHYANSPNKVNEIDIEHLLTRGQERHQNLDKIEGREILYSRNIRQASLTIFNGGHEMLSDFCFERMLKLAEK